MPPAEVAPVPDRGLKELYTNGSDAAMTGEYINKVISPDICLDLQLSKYQPVSKTKMTGHKIALEEGPRERARRVVEDLTLEEQV